MQDFIWVADLIDGTTMKEIEDNGTVRLFKEIPKEKVVCFGLVGLGMQFYFDAFCGIFNLAGRRVEISYVENGKEYYLTGQPKHYNDIISYKQACADIDPIGGGVYNQQILQYCAGYKTQLHMGDVKFYFKPIFYIPMNGTVYMKIWLVSNKKMDGYLKIVRNGQLVEQIPFPMVAGVGKETTWKVR